MLSTARQPLAGALKHTSSPSIAVHSERPVARMLSTTRQPLLARFSKPTLSMLQVQQRRSLSWHSQDYSDVDAERRRRLELGHYKDQQKADYEIMAALRASNQLKSEIISDLRNKLRQQQSNKVTRLDGKPEVAVQRSQRSEAKEQAAKEPDFGGVYIQQNALDAIVGTKPWSLKQANEVAEPSAVQLRQRSQALASRGSISDHLKPQKSATKDHIAGRKHDQELRWPTYQEAEPLILYSKQQLNNIKRELDQVNQTEKEVTEATTKAKNKELAKEEKVLSEKPKAKEEQAAKEPDFDDYLGAAITACVLVGICLAALAAPVLILIDAMWY